MKFSGKMSLKIRLKLTENQGFTLFLEGTFFEKPQWGRGQTDNPPPPPPSRFRIKPVIKNLPK